MIRRDRSDSTLDFGVENTSERPAYLGLLTLAGEDIGLVGPQRKFYLLRSDTTAALERIDDRRRTAHSFYSDGTSCLSSQNLRTPIIEIRTCSEFRDILQPLLWDRIEMHFQECENG